MLHIEGSAFVPQQLTIAVGDTVQWMNADVLDHTSTAANNEWSSPTLGPGNSFSHTFNAAGSFNYFCTPHPFMTGTIIVQGAGATPPPTVAITSPANNTVLPAPTAVTIEATAIADTGATIVHVEFFDGTTSLGMDESSPYSISANLARGTHSLTAKAMDSRNVSGTSAAVSVSVSGGGTAIEDPFPQKIQKGSVNIELKLIAEGLISPLGIAAPNDQSGRLFVYDQAGLIYVIKNGVKLAEPLLDVRNRLVALNQNYDERGLLGVATHPDFPEKPLIYTYTSEPNGPMADFMVMYNDDTTNNHQSVIAEWRIDVADPDRVDPASRRELLRVDKPQSNHNGGTIRFGHDDLLYISIGDGGAADDQGDGHSPGGNGQDRSNVLGKVIRVDVDARTSGNSQYGVPTDNPFVGQTGVVPEIYAYGLRNPYSFSFDKQNGDLLLGDVGQNHVEEVDRVTKGANLGWPIKEGAFYFDPNGTNRGFITTQPVRDVPPDLVDPIAQYDHDEGVAVIGGYMYRGAGISGLVGKYVTGDWGKFDAAEGRLLYVDGAAVKELRIMPGDRSLGMWLKGFGEDQSGELYVFASNDLGPVGTSGKMFKLVTPNFAISEVTRDGNTLTIRWIGGSPPYKLEKMAPLTENGAWTEVDTFTVTNATLTIEGDAAFFRVSSP